MGSSFMKVNRFLDEFIGFGHLDHRGQEAAFAVFALQLTLASCERKGRIAAAPAFVPDHAREIEGNLGAVVCPGFSESLFKEEFIVGGHVCHSHYILSPAA
jgi:hypothetical protein